MSADLWEFEGPDPDVGIFGNSVVHCCAANDEHEEATSADVMRNSKDGKTVRVTTTWTCPACQVTTDTDADYPREWFEEPRP